MSWYVFALVDQVPARPLGRGIGAPVAVRRFGGCTAVVERRDDVPPIEMGTLSAHDRLVTAIWKNVPATLPVRFGTLMEAADLRDALEEREEERQEAFAFVRGRGQFTWRARAAGRRPPTRALAPAASGTEYLRRAARHASPAPPARYAPLRKALKAFIAGERFEPATGAAPERLYHLVDKTQMDEYAARARDLSATPTTLVMTGPWPPYAFAPDFL